MPLPMVNAQKTSTPSRIKNIIAVAAGKGGVGKSTVTVNLALALKKLGFRVGILDADLYGPSIRKILPESQFPKQKGKKIIPAEAQGIPIISMAYFRREEEASAVRAPIANGIIQQFIQDVLWGELDYLLIDFPPGTGDIQLTLSQKANVTGAIMVTTPQELALADVKKAMHLFHQVQVPILGVVENMSYLLHEGSGDLLYPFGKGGGKRLSKEYGVSFLGEIPLDEELCLCADRGESFFVSKNAMDSTLSAFKNLANQLVDQTAGSHSSGEEFVLNWKKVPEPPYELSGMIRTIKQVDPFHFSINWSNNEEQLYRLSQLQKACPCAGCVEERSKETLKVNEEVRALRITNVGRYAIRIEFTEGCSAGIYHLSQLKEYSQVCV